MGMIRAYPRRVPIYSRDVQHSEHPKITLDRTPARSLTCWWSIAGVRSTQPSTTPIDLIQIKSIIATNDRNSLNDRLRNQ